MLIGLINTLPKFMTDSPTILDSTALADIDTDTIKRQLLQLVESRDRDRMSQKVRFLEEQLLPFFTELERRNPTSSLTDEVPLVQGVWRSVWSTIPFQDILPGRLRDQSYQIFADNGFYANLARYKPGNKIPLLGGLVRRLFSYDLMIVQTYGIDETDTDITQSWDIQNVSIRQVVRWGINPLDVSTAQTWFEDAVIAAQNTQQPQENIIVPAQSRDRATEKKYEKVFKSKPQLEHLYIDHDFRLVKTRREKNQRPSYTIAVRVR